MYFFIWPATSWIIKRPGLILREPYVCSPSSWNFVTLVAWLVAVWSLVIASCTVLQAVGVFPEDTGTEDYMEFWRVFGPCSVIFLVCRIGLAEAEIKRSKSEKREEA